MADYDNPLIPEGINVSPTHPLKEFALLVGGISALLLVTVLALSLAAGYLVRFIPFAQEQALANSVAGDWLKTRHEGPALRKEQYLQALADRLAANLEMPANMPVTVHYSADQTINAMATLGGHVIVFQGLIDTLPNENALAMVMAHEIAHVRHRHPIVAMGRGFTVALALSALAGVGEGMIEQWAGSMGMLSVLSFSREQEREADADALQALLRTYGHVGGAATFFEYIAREEPGSGLPALLNTHPGHAERIARIRQFEKEHPASQEHELKPLPDDLRPPRHAAE